MYLGVTVMTEKSALCDFFKNDIDLSVRERTGVKLKFFAV